jgi:hypothetical protein
MHSRLQEGFGEAGCPLGASPNMLVTGLCRGKAAAQTGEERDARGTQRVPGPSRFRFCNRHVNGVMCGKRKRHRPDWPVARGLERCALLEERRPMCDAGVDVGVVAAMK